MLMVELDVARPMFYIQSSALFESWTKLFWYPHLQRSPPKITLEVAQPIICMESPWTNTIRTSNQTLDPAAIVPGCSKPPNAM
jgi:hypothetical protein